MLTTSPRFACLAAITTAAVALTACNATSPAARDKEAATPADVDHARLLNADREPGQLMTGGRNYTAQRYSPLRQINEQNVNELGLAWYAELDTYRGVEATPL